MDDPQRRRKRREARSEGYEVDCLSRPSKCPSVPAGDNVFLVNTSPAPTRVSSRSHCSSAVSLAQVTTSREQCERDQMAAGASAWAERLDLRQKHLGYNRLLQKLLHGEP